MTNPCIEKFLELYPEKKEKNRHVRCPVGSGFSWGLGCVALDGV